MEKFEREDRERELTRQKEKQAEVEADRSEAVQEAKDMGPIKEFEEEEEEEEEDTEKVEEYRKKITALYKRFNPSKVGDVEGLMLKYKGKEDKLCAAIENKYLGQVREKIESIYQKHNPAKLNDVDRLLHKFKGKEVQLLEAIEKRYAKMAISEKKEEPEKKKKKTEKESEFEYIKPLLIKRMKPHVLKDALKDRGLSTQGTKKDLMDRLIAWQEENC
uniref:SAP domain-containing protein n=1 Tax=Lotharella oceanica TaxID=641309 RepID=A0A7S2TX72_9EUKA